MTKTSRWPIFSISSAGLAGVLVLLCYLRHESGVLDAVYRATNILGNHEAAHLHRSRFDQLAGSLGMVLLAAMLAVVVHSLRARYRNVAVVLGTVVTFVVVYADSMTFSVARVAGRLYFYICDDAFISMRYARNLASGLGLVYNAGERVEGYTNPLWTLFMAVPLTLGVHEGLAPGIVSVVGGVLLLATALLVQRVLSRRGVAVWLQIVALLALLFDASLFEYALAGLETPAIGFAATLVFCSALLERERGVLVGLALLPTIRPDGLLIGFLLVAWLMLEAWLTRRTDLRQLIGAHRKRILVLSGAGAAMLAWHLVLYGQLAPNTYYLKMFALSARVLSGICSYGLRGVLYYGIAVSFVLWAGVTVPRAQSAARMMLPVLVVWAYGIYVGGDAFPHLRFVGPVAPLLWTSLALAAQAVWDRWASLSRVVFPGLLLFFAPHMIKHGVVGEGDSWEPWIKDNVVAAKTIEKVVPEDARIAVFYAGTVPYFAPEHRFLDLLGKTDKEIAHQTKIYGWAPGHNKFDFDYAYDVRKADITFSALRCDDVDRFLALPENEQQAVVDGLPSSDYQAPFRQPVHPTFRARYVPNRVIARRNGEGTGHTVGCWYVREGANVPIVWDLTDVD
jgi:arabinofuranosyltransferase